MWPPGEGQSGEAGPNVNDGEDLYMMPGAIQSSELSKHSVEPPIATELEQGASISAQDGDDLRRQALWDTTEEIVEEPLQESSVQPVRTLSSCSLDETKEFMLGRGWCHHQVEYLAQVHKLPVLQTFAQLDRRTHRPEDHRPCLQRNSCIAYNSPPDERYQTKHTEDCSGCYMVETPQNDLIHVIQSGGIPLMSIHEARDGHLSLKVHRRGFRSRYASISHVWADGLGNPDRNALPSCQIRELRSMLQWVTDNYEPQGRPMVLKKYDNFVFKNKKIRLLWMDTLCIPVRRDLLHLRLRCIDAMASIYAGSEIVTVFDKELMRSHLRIEPQAPGSNDLWPLYQIAASVWMCRSWTLQEAVLPPDCIFRFKDGYFHPKKDRYQPMTANDPGYWSTEDELQQWNVRRDAIVRTVFDECLGARDREAPSEIDNFVLTWNSLAGRSTTKAEDLYVVLASCLDFKLYQFRQYTSIEEKMQHMVFSFHSLPLALLFNTGPRMNAGQDHYNRWVPTEVSKCPLQVTSTFSFPDQKISKYSEQGSLLSLHLQQETVLHVDRAIPLFFGTTLLSEQSVLKVDPVLAQDEEFRTEVYVGTVFIISQVSQTNTWRGACFYVLSERSRPATDMEIDFEMVYRCPISATLATGLRIPSDYEYNTHVLNSACRFNVKFKPIPSSAPLKRQIRQRQYDGDPATLAAAAIVVTLFSVPFYVSMLRVMGTAEATDLTEFCLRTLALAGFVLVSFVPLGLISGAVVYVAIRVRDYLFLYESYDDQSVANKLGRLAKVLAMKLLLPLRFMVRSFGPNQERHEDFGQEFVMQGAVA